MIFYVLTPLIYRLNNSLFRSISWFLIFAVISWAARIYQLANLPGGSATHVYYSYATTFSFLTQAPVWMLGIVTYYIINGLAGRGSRNMSDSSNAADSGSRMLRAVFGVILFLIGTALSVYQACTTSIIMEDNKVLLFGIWFMIVCIGLSLCRNIIVDNIVFRFIGKYSYGLYLFHPVIYRLYEERAFDVQDDVLNWLIEFAITAAIGLAASFIMTVCLDNPLQKLVKKVTTNE